MRHYQVGRGPDGKSVAVIDREVVLDFAPGEAVAIDRIDFWPAAELAEGIAGAVTGADSAFHRIAVDEGDLRWTFMCMAPGHVSKVHHTDTWDFNLVVTGDCICRLGAQDVHLFPGDTILMTGLEHQWRAGPGGCTVASVVRGMRRTG